jgi:hypothetical protein
LVEEVEELIQVKVAEVKPKVVMVVLEAVHGMLVVLAVPVSIQEALT